MATSEDYTGIDVLEVLKDARRYNEFLIDAVRRQAEGRRRLLDFGAGIGTFARAMRAAGFGVSCVEPDLRMAEGLRAEGFETHAAIPAGKAFDLIYTLNVLEHIEDDAGTLAAFRRALAADGTLYVYVPAFAVLYSAFDKRVGHLRRYRRGDLVAKVRAAGFTVRSARYVDSLGFFAALVYKLIAKDDGAVSPASVRLYDTWFFPLSRLLDGLVGQFFGKNLEVVADLTQSH